MMSYWHKKNDIVVTIVENICDKSSNLQLSMPQTIHFSKETKMVIKIPRESFFDISSQAICGVPFNTHF